MFKIDYTYGGLPKEEYEAVISENGRRKRSYYREYDPIIGDDENEVIKRRPLTIDGVLYHVPEDMWKSDFVRKYRAAKQDVAQMLADCGLPDTADNEIDVIDELFRLRLKYDFEFYAALCIRIQDKQSKAMIPLILNRGQRILLKQYEEDRIAGRPCRVVLVKSRQWGGSTLTAAYMFWMMRMHYKNWHTTIVALDQSQAVNIRTMMKKMIKELPEFHEATSFKRHEGRESSRIIPETGAIVQIGSAEKPEALRSYDFSMVHMSEVGLWKATKTKSGADIAQTVYSTVPYVAGTMIVYESTAKGVGNFFHEQYLAAKDNKEHGYEGYQPVFVAWFDDKRNQSKINHFDRFVKTMTPYQWWQWRQGATLEGIKWYAETQRAQNWNDFQMKSEYPTTADEAFQTTGGTYFSNEMLEYLKSNIKKPVFIGEIKADAVTGEDALENIKLYPNSAIKDSLKIWIHPDDYTDTTKTIKNRFVVVVDVGGRSEASDRSVISVFDRLSLAYECGALERAALWYGHVDPDILAYKAAQIAKYYNDALLVIESNTYDTRYKKKDKSYVAEGDHSYTVLDTLGEIYDNIYVRRSTPDNTRDKQLKKIGWHMNKQTKYQAYDSYSISIRKGQYVEYSQDAYNEAMQLTVNTDGQIEAMLGCHDDIQDTTAVGNYIAIESMPPVKIIDNTIKKQHQVRSGGVASF
jgi:hypothetical protein